jgi:FAD/FMN-containing dehydrogenase
MTRTIGRIDELRAAMDGSVIVPGEPGYDEARTLWNADVERHPSVVVMCASASDVAAALRFAHESGLEVAVRGGGHSAYGASSCDDGLMIHLGGLNKVTVDPVARRARCSGGATLGDLDAATQEHGLAVPLGSISHTGVGGLTLGGGFGYLTHMLGLSIDNLESAEVVLVDGRVVRASADDHPDLFWALRGGGGNFGVVTEFEFRLHPVGPLVHVSMFFWGLDHAAEALRLARDTCNGLPRNTGGVIPCLNAPPAPFVPEQYHYMPGVALTVVGFGSAQEHAALIAPVREALPPLFELVTPMPYTALQQMINDVGPWGRHYYSKGLFLDDLTDDAIDVLAEHLPRKSSPMTILPIMATGGAFHEVGDDDTALAGPRSARFNVGMDAVAPTAELLAADREWVRSLWDALRPFATDGGGYLNFQSDVGNDRVQAAYGSKYERLARIKATYDPGNVLHRNANIKPG